MTTHFSEDTAMQALEAARPTFDSLDDTWSPTRSDHVLHAVLDQTSRSPHTVRHVSRRWALVAAVAGIAAIGLIGQAVIPSGSLGSATAAQALDRLSKKAVAITIPDGKLLKVVTSHTAEPDAANDRLSTLATTWYAADGWAWSTARYNDSPEMSYVRDKWPSDIYITLLPQPLPEDPAAVVAAIKQRAADYVAKHPNKVVLAFPPDWWVVAATSAALEDMRTSVADRALLIRCLGVLPDVSVDEHATDPLGRAAVKVTGKYPDPSRPNSPLEYRLFLDETGLVLAAQIFSDGDRIDKSWVTERSIVDSVPHAVVKLVGSGHTTKTVTR